LLPQVTEVPAIRVEAAANMRKGKKFITIDISFTAKWQGECGGTHG
jgi:hypothetical protein